jgi:hypothetical protein
MTERNAAQLVNYEDKRLANLYRRLGKEDYNNPELYHLVLNMGKLDLQTAMNIVCTKLV